MIKKVHNSTESSGNNQSKKSGRRYGYKFFANNMSTQNIAKNVTVLGASGNVGKLLVEHLDSSDYYINAVGRNKPKFDSINVANLAVNYDDLSSLIKVCEGAEVVYCLVGLEYKSSVWEAKWVPLIERIIQACVTTGSKLVFFDNVYAYGPVDGKMTESSPLHPTTRKGRVRKTIQEKLEKARADGKLKLVIAKSADFYGPSIHTSVLGDRFLDLLVKKSTLEIFGNPAKIHNYTFVPDIPPALEVLGFSDFQGVIHLPTGPALSGAGFQQILEKILGKQLKLTGLRQQTVWWLGIFMPILRELHEMMYQSENDYDFDSTQIQKLFPELKLTSYEEGFGRTLGWYERSVGVSSSVVDSVEP